MIYWRIVARNSLASRFKNPQRRSQVWFTDIRVVLVARSCMRGIGPQIERDSVESIIFGTSNPKSKFSMKCSNSRSVGVHGVVVGTSDRKSSHHKFQFWRGSFQTQIRTPPPPLVLVLGVKEISSASSELSTTSELEASNDNKTLCNYRMYM